MSKSKKAPTIDLPPDVRARVDERLEKGRLAEIQRKVEHIPVPRTIKAPVLFSVKNVSVDFKKVSKALNNVNFSVYEGEVVLILGASGSGKSTLLNLIEGDKKSKTLKKLKRPSGKIITGDKKIIFPRGILSKKFSIPSLTIWDEKNGKSQGALGETARERSSAKNETFLIAAHKYMPSIFNCADRVLFLNKGKLLWNSTPTEAFDAFNKGKLPKEMAEYITEYKKVYGWNMEVTERALSRPAEPWKFKK